MTTEVWTPLALVRWTAGYFGEHGIAAPRLDAELLLAHALGVERIDLYLQSERIIGEAERARFRELVRQRAQKRVPVAYLTGTREFWSRPFHVSPDVLIPRPETETLVGVARDLSPRRIAEIGVGAGAIAAALALELPEARIVAVDASAPALALARENLERLGLRERVLLLRGDAAAALGGPVDLVISNPPYIPSRELDHLPPEVQHEPRLALDGGGDGLELIRRLVGDAPRLLRAGGELVLEIGEGQAPAVEALLREAGAERVVLHPDLSGTDRAVVAYFARGGC